MTDDDNAARAAALQARMTDNTAWLVGYRIGKRGGPCPWGNPSARLGWIAGRADAAAK